LTNCGPVGAIGEGLGFHNEISAAPAPQGLGCPTKRARVLLDRINQAFTCRFLLRLPAGRSERKPSQADGVGGEIDHNADPEAEDRVNPCNHLRKRREWNSATFGRPGAPC
jgi:hypothetical protein